MNIVSIAKVAKAFETNALRVQEAKDAGKKVMGMYCLYTPGEIAVASGAIPVSLCGTRQDAVPAAEAILPRTICPLIKSSFGFMLNDSCAYLAAADIVVADTTCDGKKKMFELMAQKKNLMVLQLPYHQSADESLPYWARQFELLEKRLEREFDVTVSRDDLYRAAELMDRERMALKRVLDTAKHNPSPLTGVQMVELCFKTGFFPDKEMGISMLNEVAEELEGMIQSGLSPLPKDAPRILLTGVPIGMGSHKVVKLLDDSGASVVCLDNCSGYKKTRVLMNVLPEASKEDMRLAMAKRYLDIPCSVMSPNPGRYEALHELTRDFAADAVVDLTWQGCHTYNVEAYSIRKFIDEELGLPALHLESDYSESDTEQLRVRIEAFLEMVRERKN